MLKKCFTILITIILIIGMYSSVNALELKTRLEVIEKESDKEYLENNQGYISKAIVDSDGDKGEVTIDLNLSNATSIIADEKEKYDNTEIYIIISENIVNNTEEFNKYVSYIDMLSTKVFEKSANSKIGIIGMKGTVSDGEVDENGNMIWGEEDEGSVEGSASNAEIVVDLTKNSEDIKSGIQEMNSGKKTYRTNLQAAIKLANNSYSDNSNKLLICLYDGVPSIAIGVNSMVQSGGTYGTLEEAVTAKHQQIAEKTKNEILSLKDNNVDFIILRPDDTSYDEKWYSMTTGELTLEFNGSRYVQEIYGTLENPTYGKMYSLSNDSLEKIVTEYIYEDIMEEIRTDLKSVVIKEYFSEEIINNFDIIFSDENIDTTNLNENNYIVWDAGDVPGNKNVSLRYTLKIKDMKNNELLNKIISTSDKTELKYINYLGTETTKILNNSPKIKLTEIKEELEATVSYNPTEQTTGSVTDIIKTNKKVKPVDGWNLLEDGKTLTKVYNSNTTEIVHLVDLDEMTKDIEVKITNIVKEDISSTDSKNEKDNTLANKDLPNAGRNILLAISTVIMIIALLVFYKKQSEYKDIK